VAGGDAGLCASDAIGAPSPADPVAPLAASAFAACSVISIPPVSGNFVASILPEKGDSRKLRPCAKRQGNDPVSR